MAARKRNKPITSGYKPVDQRWVRQPRDLPIMSFVDILHMLREPTVKLGLAMRAAPLANAEFAYKEDGSDEWIPGIKASSPVIGRYVHRQLKVIWDQLSALDTAQIWGWSAAEVMLKQTLSGTVEVGDLLPRHANDTRAVVFDGKVGAIRFNRIEGSRVGYVELAVNEPRSGIEGPPVPKAIFHTFNPDAGAVYGTSVLEGAFSPWVDKWHKGGALDVRRLTMVQNSISGRKLWYPDGGQEVTGYGTGEDPSKPVPNRDIARQLVEQMKAGAVVTLPSDLDDKGNQRWQLEEAQALSGLEYILKYPQDLDVEILRGMEIPDDVLTSVEGKSAGSWSGKEIPLLAFYTALDRWLRKLVRDIRFCILDWLVAYNFGPGNWFEIEAKPLAVQAQEQQAKKEPQQGTPQPMPQPQPQQQPQRNDEQPAQRMSLEDGEAAAIVTATRKYLRTKNALADEVVASFP